MIKNIIFAAGVAAGEFRPLVRQSFCNAKGCAFVRNRAEDALDRRSFLSIAACGVFRGAAPRARSVQRTEDYWKTQGYQVAQVLPRVNQIYVHRDEESSGLRVEFVDFETMSDSDVSLLMPCASAEPGLYVIGSVGYELTLWLQPPTSALEAFIALETAATVRLLTHPERGRDVVVMLEKNDGRK